MSEMKSSELRKLVRMFNKRSKITIPKGLKGQGEMIKFLEKHGTINHKNKVFLPNTQDMGKQIRLADYDKMFPPKTAEQKAQAKQKAQTRKESSEMNMVKTLEGKGYTITKPKSAEKKPTPAPKKPVKKAEPKKKANIPMIKKSLKDLVYEGVDDLLKDDSVRVGGAVSALKKGYMKMIDTIVMEPAEKKQLKEEWKTYDKYIRSEWKLYDKPAKKAPAPKKKASAPKKKAEPKQDGDITKRPAYKLILKDRRELFNNIIKLEKQRIAGKLTKEQVEDKVDELYEKQQSKTSLMLNKREKAGFPDAKVFKMGTATKEAEGLIRKELKPLMDEADKLKKQTSKKKASAPKKKASPVKKSNKQTFKEIVMDLKEKMNDKGTDEDGDRIYSDSNLKILKEIFAIYKTLPYKLHKDPELYDLIDKTTDYRGDMVSKYTEFLNSMKSYAKSKK